ncbi:hypothetical protein ACWEC4_40030 [Streptomyces sp. NPDC005055]
MTRWLKRHTDSLNADQTQQLKAILARCPELGRAAEHVRAFAELMSNRQGGTSTSGSSASGPTTCQPCTASPTASTKTSTMSSRAEPPLQLRRRRRPQQQGQYAQRQMFGRANFDLLRKRILLAARCRS